MKKTIIADRIFDGTNFLNDIPVTFEDGIIVALDTAQGASEEKVTGTLAPGFIDIQVNGGGGVLFNETPEPDTIEKIISAHSKFGTTGILVTLITDDINVMKSAANAVSKSINNNMAGLLGVHFEGPHLSVQKRGVHTEQHIREISEDEIAIYARKDIGIRHITVAPETVAPDTIKKLVSMGIIVSLGHSNADYKTVMNAIEAGACGFTHLYNAMSPFTSREPGMVGAALNNKDSWCSIIADGHHVHPAALKVAINAKRNDKIILVTDAMAPVGTNDTEFKMLGETIKRVNNKLIAPEGQLAGSVLDMASAVQNITKMANVEPAEALRMASLYPAEFLGIDNKKSTLAINKAADFILIDKNFSVNRTWINGHQKYKK